MFMMFLVPSLPFHPVTKHLTCSPPWHHYHGVSCVGFGFELGLCCCCLLVVVRGLWLGVKFSLCQTPNVSKVSTCNWCQSDSRCPPKFRSRLCLLQHRNRTPLCFVLCCRLTFRLWPCQTFSCIPAIENRACVRGLLKSALGFRFGHQSEHGDCWNSKISCSASCIYHRLSYRCGAFDW